MPVKDRFIISAAAHTNALRAVAKVRTGAVHRLSNRVRNELSGLRSILSEATIAGVSRKLRGTSSCGILRRRSTM